MRQRDPLIPLIVFGLKVFPLFSAWCLRSEGVSSVLLGVSTTDQLLENLGAMRVQYYFSPSPEKLLFSLRAQSHI